MRLRALLLFSAICTAIMMVVMMLHGAPLKIEGITPHGIIDLELACTPARATQVLQAWPGTLRQRAVTNTYIDFIFIVAYGTLLSTLCIKVSSQYQGAWRTIGKWLSIAMLLAAFFDVTENILMFKTLHGSLGKELIASIYMFAFTKFLLVATGILYILLSFVAGLFKRNTTIYRNQPSRTL